MSLYTCVGRRRRCRYGGSTLLMVRNEVPGGDFPDGFRCADTSQTDGRGGLRRAGLCCMHCAQLQQSVCGMLKGARRIAVVAALWCCLCGCSAASIRVSADTTAEDVAGCGGEQNPCATLSYAVTERAVANDTVCARTRMDGSRLTELRQVLALPGVHRATAWHWVSPLEIQNAITVKGSSGAIVDCEGVGRGFVLQADAVTLETLTVRSCVNNDLSGGGVLISGKDAVLTGVTVENCTAHYGGGIAVTFNASASFKDIIIRNSTATVGGG